MTKKWMSGILAVTMTMSLFSPAMAATKDEIYMIPEQGAWVDLTEMAILDESETETYNKYELKFDVTSDARSAGVTSWDILELCNCVGEEIYDGHVVRTYTTEDLDDLIDNCAVITGISSLDSIVYVAYTAIDGNEVVLGYTVDGLVEKCVYNPKEDSAVSITDDAGIMYSNFRYGNYYQMSDATEEYIETCLEDNNIEKLKNTLGLSVTIEDGFTMIEEVPVAKVAAPPTTENNVVATLKSDFPQYSKKQVYSTTGTVTALGKSASIKVYETRANYVKKSVNIVNYGVGTVVSSIMTAFGFSTATPVLAILSALNIACTVATEGGKLQDAVNLCRTAKFSFIGNRRGDVYDSTKYNDYVKVIDLTSSGEFTYGYDKDGNYIWVVSMTPTCYDVAYTKIANDALTNYNWDVANNSYCSQYAPA